MGRAARYIGILLALGFIAFLVWRDAGEMPALDLGSAQVWLGLTAALVLYVVSQLIGAFAWRTTLSIYSVHLPRGRAESQLLVSQIGKYVPGNVAHILGRAVLARADGAGGAAIAGSMSLEVGFLLGAGALAFGMAFLFAPGLPAALAEALPAARIEATGIPMALGLLLCVALAQVVLWRRAGRPPIGVSRCALPLLLHLLNFAVLGMSLWCVAAIVAPQTPIGVPQCIAIFTTAWLAGFVVPGAPGGVGVRDGIIAIGLEMFLAPGAALGVALMHRALSVLGDICVFGIGLAMRPRAAPTSIPLRRNSQS